MLHGHTIFANVWVVYGPIKKTHEYVAGMADRMKNTNGFLSIQLGIGWLAGRLRPVSAPAS
jgi:hypothetical protein